MEKSGARVEIYPDPEELALQAARRFAELARRRVADSGRFTVALSGGSTPKAMFSLLAEEPFIESLPWSKIYFFWGDERSVPPDHPDSNYRMVRESLLSKVTVPAENIFRMRGEVGDHGEAAESYSRVLREFFSLPEGSPSLPQLDLVLLGMGADGHTASLFPHTTALDSGNRIAVANYVEKLGTHRITLTPATINNAHDVTFVVAGEDKAPALKQVLEESGEPNLYPSRLIRPASGSLLWMIDEAAARLLKGE